MFDWSRACKALTIVQVIGFEAFLVRSQIRASFENPLDQAFLTVAWSGLCALPISVAVVSWRSHRWALGYAGVGAAAVILSWGAMIISGTLMLPPTAPDSWLALVAGAGYVVGLWSPAPALILIVSAGLAQLARALVRAIRRPAIGVAT